MTRFFGVSSSRIQPADSAPPPKGDQTQPLLSDTDSDMGLVIGGRLFSGVMHTVNLCTYQGREHGLLVKRANWLVNPFSLEHEADIFRKMQQKGEHENVVSMLFAGVVRYPGCCITTSRFSIVMEDGGRNLAYWIKNQYVFQLDDFKQIAGGVDYLHNVARVLHVDLKPWNILRNNRGAIKICDFGLSLDRDRDFAPQIGDKIPGAKAYLAPEILLETFQRTFAQLAHLYTTKSDVYSLGIIFAEMLLQHFTFAGVSEGLLYDMMTRDERPALPETVCSKEFSILVSSMWNPRAAARPEMDQVVERLNELSDVRSSSVSMM